MKETIFFNKEQVKIITIYGWIYKILFKYGVFLLAFILSLVIIFFVPKLKKIQNFSLNTAVNLESSFVSIEEKFNKNYAELNKIEKLTPFIIDGDVYIEENNLISENNLILFSDELVLPRIVSLSRDQLSYYYQFNANYSYKPQQIELFYKDVILAPLDKNIQTSAVNVGRLALNKDLKSNFSLECLDTSSKNSLVCKYYINTFLDTFPYYKLENSYWEFKNIVANFLQNAVYRQKICKGITKMLDFGADSDLFLRNIIYDCDDGSRTYYMRYHDFDEVQKGLSIAYINSSVSLFPEINYYKLLSTQQLLLKQIRGGESIASLLASYFSFIKELLIKDMETKDLILFGDFYKGLTYWFNNHIILPVLNNETSKITKEQKTTLLTDLLMINNGNKMMGFEGLQMITEEHDLKDQDNDGEQGIIQLDLKKLFIDNYLPPQFSLLSAEIGHEDDEFLKIKGVDNKSEFNVEANLKFANNILYVDSLMIAENKDLTNYLNVILQTNQYIFTKTLGLIEEYREIAGGSYFGYNLCEDLKEIYNDEFVSCSTEKLVLKNKDGMIYSFYFDNDALVKITISDYLLEKQLLTMLNFDEITQTNTKQRIESILNYKIEDEDSGFGMKATLQVIEYFKNYLNIEPNNIEHDHGIVRVFFIVQDIKFIARYDLAKNSLSQIGFDVGIWKDGVIIKNLTLDFSKSDEAKINAFILNPLEMVRKTNPAVVQKYFGTGSILLPKEQR